MQHKDDLILRRAITSNQMPEMIWWVNSAYMDYRAARILLNSGELLQGAVLANTAVEKYAKATVLVKGDKVHGHLKRGMFRGIKNFCKEHFDSLNMEFMDLLQHSYQARYFVDLPKGFHIEIFQNKFLVELDNTAFQFNQRFNFKVEDKTLDTMYVEDFKTRNPALLYNNYALLHQDKRVEFIAKLQHYLDFKKLQDGSLVMFTAKAGGVQDDGKFIPTGIDHLEGKTPHDILREQLNLPVLEK